jgi:hypothetical protein
MSLVAGEETVAEQFLARRPMPVLIYELAQDVVKAHVRQRWPHLTVSFGEYHAPAPRGPLVMHFALPREMDALVGGELARAVPFGQLRIEYDHWHDFGQEGAKLLDAQVQAVLRSLRPIVEAVS